MMINTFTGLYADLCIVANAEMGEVSAIEGDYRSKKAIFYE
jgi:hypothetical protein